MTVNMNLGYTTIIVDTCRKHGLLRNQAAYVLATAYWETAKTMNPVVEAFWKSEEWRRVNLRYYPWHGRGFVQLTWRDNYVKAGKALKMDFTTNPAKVMEPKISAEILVLGSMQGWFTGKKLGDYITLQKSEYVNARRVINGTDRATEIAALAREYESALLSDGYGVTQPPADYVAAVNKPSSGFWAGIVKAILQFFQGK